jgi:hypothetical protein
LVEGGRYEVVDPSDGRREAVTFNPIWGEWRVPALGCTVNAALVGGWRLERWEEGEPDGPFVVPEYTPKLGDLLAYIHRDGGHHTAEVGEAQSIRDAIDVVCKWRDIACYPEPTPEASGVEVDARTAFLEKMRAHAVEAEAREKAALDALRGPDPIVWKAEGGRYDVYPSVRFIDRNDVNGRDFEGTPLLVVKPGDPTETLMAVAKALGWRRN